MTESSSDTRPLVLISNDDGYAARGLIALYESVRDVADVWVVAPERERSAASHAISLHKPLRMRRTGEQTFWCSGSPADCVYIAVHHLLPRAPDFVLSGINSGPNLAQDVVYSGTVAAAREAAMLGIPSMACSQVIGDLRADYEPAATLATSIMLRALKEGMPPDTFLNLNVPDHYDAALGWVAAPLGKRDYGHVVTESSDPRGRPYYWIGGSSIHFESRPGSDCDIVDSRRAALSAVRVNLDQSDAFATLAAWSATQDNIVPSTAASASSSQQGNT